MSGYQIADEPAPSTLARFAVNPLFPLLAAMLSGVWIAWPWFALNSFAVGSPTRRKEIAWLVGGLLGLFALTIAVLAAIGAEVIPSSAARYAVLTVVVLKLTVVYAVFILQSRTIEIYEYYGGVLRNGFWVLIAAFVLRGRLIDDSVPIVLRIVLA